MSDQEVHLIAVLDSSVLVPVWSRLTLQQLAAGGAPAYQPVWSEWIIAETWRTLALQWLTQAGQPPGFAWPSLTRSANEMLRFLLPVMRLVTLKEYAGPDPWPGLTDRNDVPIWQTAVISQANYVISQNTRDFPPLVQGRHQFGGIEYLTAIEFIEDVLGENAARLYRRTLPLAASLRSGRTA